MPHCLQTLFSLRPSFPGLVLWCCRPRMEEPEPETGPHGLDWRPAISCQSPWLLDPHLWLTASPTNYISPCGAIGSVDTRQKIKLKFTCSTSTFSQLKKHDALWRTSDGKSQSRQRLEDRIVLLQQLVVCFALSIWQLIDRHARLNIFDHLH